MQYTIDNNDAFDITQHKLGDIIKEALRRHLARCDGNRAKAARSLGVTEKTVYNWLRRWKDIRCEFPKKKND